MSTAQVILLESVKNREGYPRYLPLSMAAHKISAFKVLNFHTFVLNTIIVTDINRYLKYFVKNVNILLKIY